MADTDGLFGLERGSEPVGVKCAFPAGDHDRRDRVTNEIGQASAFAHEAIDAEDQSEPRDWNGWDNRKRRREGDESRPRYARRALRADDCNEQEQRDL